MKKKLFLIVVIIGVQCAIVAQQIVHVVPNTYILKLKENCRTTLLQKSISTALQSSTISIERTFPTHQALTHKANSRMVDLSLFYTLVADANSDKVIDELMKTGCFEYVQPKYLHYNLYVPSDSRVESQWHLNTIQAYDAWNICQGDTNVVIGISDSGLDTTVVDIMSNIKYNYADPIDGIDNDNDGFVDNYYGWNIVNNNGNIYRTVIHGTFVAGISSATTDNGSELAGVGFRCKFLPVCNQNSTLGLVGGYESIVYAADHGCQIINCSWGGISPYDPYGQDIINYATFNRGALVVAAAGNTNGQYTFYPAGYDNVLSVAATNISDEKADFSTYDYTVDIMAPGKAVYSCLGSSYGTSDGTSFSAPIVSGVAALVKSAYPNFTPQQIIHRIKATADPIDTIGNNSNYYGQMGAGRVNAYRALTDVLQPSLEMSDINYNKQDKLMGDTIHIYGNFTNYLAPADNAKVVASTRSEKAILVNDTLQIGTLAMMGKTQYTDAVIDIVLTEDMTESQEIPIRLEYYDSTTYLGFQYVCIRLSDVVVIDTNEQIFTMTNCGKMGYADNYYKYGQGITSKTTAVSMLNHGSFLFGNNSSRISDNIALSLHGNEMVNVVAPHFVVEDAVADMQAETIFNDANAGGNKFDIETIHTAYAWTDSNLKGTTIQQFAMINKSVTAIDNLYAALFMDWDIGISTSNRVMYDANTRMSYTYSIFDGQMVGVKFLSNYPTKVYAFDNDGGNLSMKISNGITDLQIYNALTTNRLEAGLAANGNDVSTMTTYGPMQIASMDTITIAYAIIIGNNLLELQQGANAAQEKYNAITSVVDDTIIDDAIVDHPVIDCKIFPNPTNNTISISTKGHEIMSRIEIIALDGKKLLVFDEVNDSQKDIDVRHLACGIYFAKIYTDTKILILKFAKDN